MKTGEDFRREFPPVEDGFFDAANRALQGLHDQKEERRMKLRPMLIIAVVLALLMGVSVAATWERWSLDDFIPTGRITATEVEWRAMLADFEPVTAETSVAEVTVREALFDGYALYIVADVRPRGGSGFFVPDGCDMDAPAYKTASALPKDMTLREYIAGQGYVRTFEVSLSPSTRGMTFLPEMELNEDGTMTFYLRQRMHHDGLQTEYLDMTLNVAMTPNTGKGTYYAAIPLTIRTLPVLEEAVSPAGDGCEFANSGVALTNLRLVRTPLSTYVTIDAEVTDEEAFDTRSGSYVIRFIGPDGKRYDAGPFNLMGFMQDPIDRDHRGPLYYMSALTMTSLPDTITVIESPWGEYDPAMATDSWSIQLEMPAN